MAEYIDREKLLRDIDHYHVSDGKFQHWVEIQLAADVAPVVHGEWIDVNDRLPESDDYVLVVLAHTYEDDCREYSIARYIPFDDGSHWADSKHGYLEWDRYSGGHGWSSSYKVIAWMPIPTYKEKENV